MREKDYYGAIKGFCLKWNLPEVWNSDRITGANLIYEVIKVINAMINELREYEERVDGKLEEMLKMIEDFLKMFNEDLSDTVINILMAWKDSGELDEIINDALFNQKLDKEVFESFKETYDIFKASLDVDLLNIKGDITNLENTKSDLNYVNETFVPLQYVHDVLFIDATDNDYVNISPDFEDNSPLLNELIQKVPRFSTIFIPDGIYKFKSTVTINKPVKIKGKGGYYDNVEDVEPIFNFYYENDNDVAIHIPNSTRNVYLEGLTINNLGVERFEGKGIGILIGGLSGGDHCVYISLKKIVVYNFDTSYYQNPAWKITYEDCTSLTAFSNGFRAGTHATTTTYLRCYSNGVGNLNPDGGYGFNLGGLNYSNLINCASDFAFLDAYRFFSCKNVVMLNCGCEKTGRSAISTESNIGLNITGFLAQNTGRDENRTQPSLLWVRNDNNNVIVNSAIEMDNDVNKAQSVGGSGSADIQINGSVLLNGFTYTQGFRYDGVTTSTTKPTKTNFPIGYIIYHRNYNGDNINVWGWAWTGSQWLEMR